MIWAVGSRRLADSALLGVYNGDGGYVDDIVHTRSALEHMHGFRKAHQDGTDGFGPVQPGHSL